MHSLPQSIQSRVCALILSALCTSCSIGSHPLFYSDSEPAAVAEEPAATEPDTAAEPAVIEEEPPVAEVRPAPEPQPAVAPATPKPAALVKPAPQTTRIALRDNVPERYIVKQGDTLWDISTLFLKDPWLWPEIWYFNPQIDNPHLIYPGDVLTLVYIDGRPQLRVVRDGEPVVTPPAPPPTTTGPRIVVPEAPRGLKSVRLSPRIYTQGLDKAIPTIPANIIEPFLVKPQIVTQKQLKKAPYVVSSLDQHLATAEDHIVYVRNLKSEESVDVRYQIFRPGAPLVNPKNGKILGYETILVSEAKLLRGGDPATLILTRSLRETLNGDRILPADNGKISYNFLPKEPKTEVEGQIIGLVDSLSQTAQRQVVVINLGEQQGMEIGTVLAIDQRGGEVRDPFESKGYGTVRLPDERAGLLMVFRVFERVSYALIMESSRAIHLHDMVRNPTPSVAAANE
ncbi:MAG TPA: LysM peptidoglycan-binding domain-containing protein [Gammaproteobacteria bacterium]